MASLEQLLSDDSESTARKPLEELLATEEPQKQSRPMRSREELQAIVDADEQATKPWYERALRGAADPIIGAGQVVQNILPDAAMNTMRKAGASVAGAFGADELAEQMAKPISTKDFNAGIRRMEQYYQAERMNAGQVNEEGETTLDLARIGGTIANPISWIGATRASSLLQGIRAGAQTGAFQSLLQPVTDTDNFLYSKGMQAITGATLGGALGGAVQLLKAPLSFVVDKARNAIRGSEAEQIAAATKAADGVLLQAGVDPAKMDRNLYGAIQREVAEALQQGGSPDPRVIVNRADAASLPVPLDLTRGQATRDAMQFSWEVNNAKLRGAGEPLTEMLGGQNRKLIENLNVMGAARAPSPFDASKAVISHIEQLDAAAKARIDEAYKAARNSQGRPALLSSDDFAAASKNLLTEGNPELASLTSLADYLPPTIAKNFNDIVSGKLPLTVDTAQFLDRAWGGVQRGTQDGTIKRAIGALRTALNDAPVSDALGAESMQAYKAAREMARQRFAMIESNPAYKAVDNGVEPDRFFQKYVESANANEIEGLKQLVGPDLSNMLRDTTVANLKRIALNRASDENGVFSQAAFNKVLQDPVAAPRLQALFSDAPQTLDQLYRLGRVSENLIAFPKGHSVNTSNTAPTTANIIRDVAKTEAAASLWNLIPGARVIREVKAQHAARKAVSDALTPSNTKPLPQSANRTGRLSDLVGRAGGLATGSYFGGDRDE